MCDVHNQERKWIFSIDIKQEKPLVIKEGAVLNSKYECIECNDILMKALGYEKVKKHGRRRKRKN